MPCEYDERLTVNDFVDVRERFRVLGISNGVNVAILPSNLESASAPSEFIFEGNAESIRKLLRTAEIDVVSLVSPGPMPTRRNHDSTLILPILFFAGAHFSENPTAISLALSVLGNYATQLLQGATGAGTVKLSIVMETRRGNTFKRIDYSGPPEGLPAATRLIAKINESD